MYNKNTMKEKALCLGIKKIYQMYDENTLILFITVAGPGLYSPHYHPSLLNVSPRVREGDLIQAASPSPLYHSDSADSLTEIPVSATRHGSKHTRTTTTTGSSKHHHHPQHHHHRSSSGGGNNKAGGKHTVHNNVYEGHTNMAYYEENMAAEQMRGDQARHRDVPPLDLSSLNEDDGDGGKYKVGYKKHRKKKAAESKI